MSNKESKNEPALKYDAGKLQWSLLPKDSMEAAIKVLQFGAEKYGRFNWKKGMSHSRLIDATMRHLWAHVEGETIDSESGELHLAHALVDIMFLIHYVNTNTGTNDLVEPSTKDLNFAKVLLEVQQLTTPNHSSFQSITMG
jgi:hypothetical protein